MRSDGRRGRGQDLPALPKEVPFTKSEGCLYRLKIHGVDGNSKYKVLLDLIL